MDEEGCSKKIIFFFGAARILLLVAEIVSDSYLSFSIIMVL